MVRFNERPHEGRFQIRAKVAGTPNEENFPPKLQIWLGFQATGVVYTREMLAELDVQAAPNNTKILNFERYLENFPLAFELDKSDLERIGKGNESREGLMIWFVAGGNSKGPSKNSAEAKLLKLKKDLKEAEKSKHKDQQKIVLGIVLK